MNEQDVREFLKYIGVSRKPQSPTPNWNINQLQYAGVFFGLAGEDGLLRQLFKRRLWANEPGTYVDIGCANPAYISNTFYFYMIGWRGVGVDANVHYAEQWRSVRPNDTFVNAAITDGDAQLLFFENTSNPGASIVATALAAPSAASKPGIPVPTERMDSLLARTIGNRPIHLLNMDIEGGELSALKSNDWSRWRPELIHMECHGFDFDQPYAEPAVAYLKGLGYKLRDKIGANVIMTCADL